MIGIGIDEVEIERFRRVLLRTPGVLSRCFTEGERSSLATRNDPVPGLAARFAAKEATMKALGVGLGAIGLVEIEVHRLPSGRPELLLHGHAGALASSKGVARLHLSMTHTAISATAIVYAEGE